MRFIQIDKLPEVFDIIKGNGAFDSWLEQAEKHLNAIKDLSKPERAIYWSKNNYWRELYPALSNLSGNKCWYSEAPESSSEWEIEHFRPKSKSKNYNKIVIRDDGYWWLSYHWKNYRLAGSLVNKLRKDRFTEGEEVYGKGDFFPLEDSSPIAEPNDLYCTCERPLLLDPIKPRDCSLISFDKNGEVFPTYTLEENKIGFKKGSISIKHYGLVQTPLRRGRKGVWDKCDNIVSFANNYLRTYFNDENKREETIDECYSKLAELSSITEPFSMVVKSFVKIKSKEKNHEWLEDAIMVLQ